MACERHGGQLPDQTSNSRRNHIRPNDGRNLSTHCGGGQACCLSAGPESVPFRPGCVGTEEMRAPTAPHGHAYLQGDQRVREGQDLLHHHRPQEVLFPDRAGRGISKAHPTRGGRGLLRVQGLPSRIAQRGQHSHQTVTTRPAQTDRRGQRPTVDGRHCSGHGGQYQRPQKNGDLYLRLPHRIQSTRQPPQNGSREEVRQVPRLHH